MAGRCLAALTQTTLSESLMRLRSLFFANDSFVFANRVMQREPGMANNQNCGRSSERELAFRGQGFAVADVRHALLESDHDQPPSSPEILARLSGSSSIAALIRARCTSAVPTPSSRPIFSMPRCFEALGLLVRVAAHLDSHARLLLRAFRLNI